MGVRIDLGALYFLKVASLNLKKNDFIFGKCQTFGRPHNPTDGTMSGKPPSKPPPEALPNRFRSLEPLDFKGPLDNAV